MSISAEIAGSRLKYSAFAVRGAGIVASLLVAGILVVLAATGSAVAATALFVGGMAEPKLYEPIMSMALGGMFKGTDPASDTPWVRRSVYWPAQMAPFWGFTSLGDSVSQGTTNLIADIAAARESANGPVTVVGASAGTLVVDEALRYYQEHPDQAPDPEGISFVVIADGSRQDAFRAGSQVDTVSGYTYRTPSKTVYNVSVVTYKYDGFADFPDQPLNLLADVNALAGMLVLHNVTWFADISNMTPTSVVTDPVTGGTTTRYLIAPHQLPLVTLMPFLAPIQNQLKQIIDTGYSRNDTATTAKKVTLSSSTISPVVTPAAKAQSVDAPTTPPVGHASVADAPADSRTQANQPSIELPKVVKQSVTREGDLLPKKRPATNPVRDAFGAAVKSTKTTVEKVKGATESDSGKGQSSAKSGVATDSSSAATTPSHVAADTGEPAARPPTPRHTSV